MPVIRVEVPEGTSQEIKTRIREGVKHAVLETLAPKEIKYDYVGVREVFGILGDGLPLVTVVSDKCEPVSARTVKLSLMPRKDRATRRERRRGYV